MKIRAAHRTHPCTVRSELCKRSVKLSYDGSFAGPPSQIIPTGNPRKIASFRHYNSEGATFQTENVVREQDLGLEGV
jgi:hypothetical protein